MDTQKVTVTLELDIDVAEWMAQFPDENTPDIIAQSVTEQVNDMVRTHYYDQGWTGKR